MELAEAQTMLIDYDAMKEEDKAPRGQSGVAAANGYHRSTARAPRRRVVPRFKVPVTLGSVLVNAFT
eukprot:16097282-Heterocapsa_arctica.AAC.1